MKAAKTWCVAGLLVVAAFSSASCGKDEADGDGKGGSGVVVPNGGSAGTAGSGRGGDTATAGSGGTMAAAATKLGRGCIDDADCADTKAPGLTCVTATDTVLGNGAPPKGLCTAPCTADAECQELGAGALCYPFDEGGESGYCVEACSFGDALGQTKCHNRPEFACTFVGAVSDTGEACTDTEKDCQPGELCSNGSCLLVFPACMPSCRGDIDCEDGMYCDQAFLSGVCVKEKPPGKGLGEPCTVPPEGEEEPDDCVGFCQADSTGSTSGHCAATCALGRECGWDAATEKFDGACLYASVITREIGAIGDFGFCAPTCNCSEECKDATLACSLLDDGELPDTFRGPGLCFSPEADTEEYNHCTGAGGAGSGGSGSDPSGGAASAGEGGGGAAP
jgi:hypothetical protein